LRCSRTFACPTDICRYLEVVFASRNADVIPSLIPQIATDYQGPCQAALCFRPLGDKRTLRSVRARSSSRHQRRCRPRGIVSDTIALAQPSCHLRVRGGTCCDMRAGLSGGLQQSTGRTVAAATLPTVQGALHHTPRQFAHAQSKHPGKAPVRIRSRFLVAADES
jgi:hypothetical protein